MVAKRLFSLTPLKVCTYAPPNAHKTVNIFSQLKQDCSKFEVASSSSCYLNCLVSTWDSPGLLAILLVVILTPKTESVSYNPDGICQGLRATINFFEKFSGEGCAAEGVENELKVGGARVLAHCSAVN
jgi:hypothetical protein